MTAPPSPKEHELPVIHENGPAWEMHPMLVERSVVVAWGNSSDRVRPMSHDDLRTIIAALPESKQADLFFGTRAYEKTRAELKTPAADPCSVCKTDRDSLRAQLDEAKGRIAEMERAYNDVATESLSRRVRLDRAEAELAKVRDQRQSWESASHEWRRKYMEAQSARELEQRRQDLALRELVRQHEEVVRERDEAVRGANFNATAIGKVLIAASLQPGEQMRNDLDHSAVDAVLGLIRERDAAIAAREADREVIEALGRARQARFVDLSVYEPIAGGDLFNRDTGRMSMCNRLDLEAWRAYDKHRAAAGEEKS